ncbi:MAG TPA: glycosyltransferase family 4 protein [Gammaproteobacteria bacterium]|nr:glycosyltransferase family 4 protein [Gammaproteobacteria bacterium]
MRIAFTTTFDAQDLHNWSGTPYYMSRAFMLEGVNVDYIGSLVRKLPPFFKVKQMWNKYVRNQRESPRFNTIAAQYYSSQVSERLKNISVDAIVSPLINPIAYLECDQPIILWTDSVYAALVGFYPDFAYHSAHSIKQGNKITEECLRRCTLAIFSSHWAANSAIELYGTDRKKVKIVPFGANIESYPAFEQVRYLIKQRVKDKIKLLFLAKSWERKGGDIVLAITKELYDSGHAVELNIIGHPPKIRLIPSYIKCLGFLSKQTPEGKAKIAELLSQSHFLILPSRAEAYGIAFCEANAYGLPCLTSYTGGIGTVVKNNINGMTFSLDTPISTYCHYIVNLMQNRAQYEALALSAYHEYISRLNWKTAIQQVKKLIEETSD